MTDEELITALRMWSKSELCREAAHRVEALVKERNESVESVSNNNDWFGCCMDVWSWLISQPDMPDLDFKEGGADECVENYKVAITALMKARTERLEAALKRVLRNVDEDGVGTVLMVDLIHARAILKETTMSDDDLIESLRLWNRDDAADRIEALVKERDAAEHRARMRKGFIEEARDERDRAEARAERLEAAIDYILDGMAIDAPDYEIDPDDDFLEAANSDWVRDVLTRLAAALKGADHD